jgi:hypothetical protein
MCASLFKGTDKSRDAPTELSVTAVTVFAGRRLNAMEMKLRFVVLLIPSILLCGCMMRLIDHMTGEDQANEIRKTGKPGTARVLKIWDTGITLNGNPVVGMRLKVRAEGIEPFEAETKALIGRLDIPQIQPGAELSVRYDPEDHTRVALDIYDERK